MFWQIPVLEYRLGLKEGRPIRADLDGNMNRDPSRDFGVNWNVDKVITFLGKIRQIPFTSSWRHKFVDDI